MNTMQLFRHELRRERAMKKTKSKLKPTKKRGCKQKFTAYAGSKRRNGYVKAGLPKGIRLMGRGRPSKWPWSSLAVGATFFAPGKTTPSMGATAAGKRLKRKFSCRAGIGRRGKGVIVTRVK